MPFRSSSRAPGGQALGTGSSLRGRRRAVSRGESATLACRADSRTKGASRGRALPATGPGGGAGGPLDERREPRQVHPVDGTGERDGSHRTSASSQGRRNARDAGGGLLAVV